MNNYTKFIVRTTFVYLGFYSLIAVAIYWTKSAAPLWALLLTPTSRYHDDGKKEEVDPSAMKDSQ